MDFNYGSEMICAIKNRILLRMTTQTPHPCVWEPVQQKTIWNVTMSVVQLISPMTKFKPSCHFIRSKEEISKQCGKILLTPHLTSSKLSRLGKSDYRGHTTNYLHTTFITARSTADCVVCGNNLNSSGHNVKNYFSNCGTTAGTPRGFYLPVRGLNKKLT